jgi:copper chaperone CopZ
MSRAVVLASLSLSACLALAAVAQAETKVTISKTHLCCGQCLTGVTAALKDVKGVTHVSDQKAKTIALVAESDEAAQRAVDALAAAGFHGKTDSEKIKYQPVKAPAGKVKRLELTGIHNCCGACTTAIKKAVAAVDGVSGNSVKAKEVTFVVEGDFSASAVVESLLDAGFQVQVKQ